MHSRRFTALAVALVTLVPTFAFAADVPAGTRIAAHIDNDIKDGIATVNYTITDDVRDAKGDIMIPKGSKAYGKVVQYRRPGMWGGPGKTEVSLDSVTLPDGKQLTVTSKATKYGRDSRAASLIFMPFLIGWFTTGGSGKVGSSTSMTFTAQ